MVKIMHERSFIFLKCKFDDFRRIYRAWFKNYALFCFKEYFKKNENRKSMAAAE